VQNLGEKVATKVGIILEPSQQPGHWASGWVGGLQLLRGREHRWIAVLNASPTAPDPGNKEVWNEEPPPSLGGFAWCDEEWPVSGWHFYPSPIEWVRDIPKSAVDAGEGYNLWRQFIHILSDGRPVLFYNSGYYGREQLYAKIGISATASAVDDGRSESGLQARRQLRGWTPGPRFLRPRSSRPRASTDRGLWGQARSSVFLSDPRDWGTSDEIRSRRASPRAFG